MWIVGLYILNAIFLLIIAIREVRKPAKALNWLAIGLIVPVVGFGLYLIVSNSERIRRGRLTSPHNEADALPDSFSRSASVIAHALRHLTVHGLRAGRAQVLTNGIETYKRLIESLQYAQQTIDLEYYIYRDDHIGRRITNLLIERAAAGVRIRFMRDGWGSRKFPQAQIVRMMEAGIECRTIFPLRLPWLLSTLNNRDHCKIVVIDGKEAYTGGINVGDEYAGLKPTVGFWRDTHVRIVGEAAADLLAVLDAHWGIASPERMNARTRRNIKTVDMRKAVQGPAHISKNKAPPGKGALAGWSAEWSAELAAKDGAGVNDAPHADAFPQRAQLPAHADALSQRAQLPARVEALHNGGQLREAYVQTLEGNPGIPTPVIRQTYFICLTQAIRTIDITTPYFVPDADIIMAIKTAAARGVRVRLLVPRHVDQIIVGHASRTYYGELLEAGVHIYQYDKGVLHAKVMIIDGEIAEIGAANYDMRSFRLNYEICEMIYSTDIAKDLTEQFERDIADSVPLRMEDLLRRPLSQRIVEQGARLFAPLL